MGLEDLGGRMPNLISRWRSWSPYFLSALRIIAAFLLVQFGMAKWFAFPGSIMPNGGTVPVGSRLFFAAVLEVIGGLLLLVGLCTRPIAFVLSGEMAVAYFLGHAPNGFWPVLNQGTPAVILCFVFLYLSAAGPGPLSVDRAIRQRIGGPAEGGGPGGGSRR
jgi:putative oxidoreductase